MKIEMCESLCYSWLRHIKGCQIVQTNWKASNNWNFNHTLEIEEMFCALNQYFEQTHQLKIFKKTTSLAQIIKQGECDVMGIFFQDGNPTYYSVDVAFHESGLNYGNREQTVLKILSKSIRTAFSLYGYFGTKSGNIIFASPKINKSVLDDVSPLIDYVNVFLKEKGFLFEIKIICNEAFMTDVLGPVLEISKSVADTNELFLRSHQMMAMFPELRPYIEKN